jgi:hypothetical protein
VRSRIASSAVGKGVFPDFRRVGVYLPEMARIPESRRRSTSKARPFFELIEQMETLLTTIELDWPDDMRADAKRRLARIARALRHAPETSERRLDIS